MDGPDIARSRSESWVTRIVVCSRSREGARLARACEGNDRDLEGILGRFHPEVRFHPLRFIGLDGSDRGHDGVRR